MGGIDGALLPLVADMLGVTDVETLLMQLTAIRDYQNEQASRRT